MAGLLALGLAVVSGWFAMLWVFSVALSVTLLASGVLLLWLACRPPIEISAEALRIGRRTIPWKNIRRVDRTGWMSPLVVHLILSSGERLLLIYPGSLESAGGLLRQLRQSAREALIDGIPHRQFWGETQEPATQQALPSPRYQVLRPDDEAEVERLYLLLKTVGHLDPKNSPEEQ